MLAPPNTSKRTRGRPASPYLHRRRLSNYEIQSDDEQTKKQQWPEEVSEISTIFCHKENSTEQLSKTSSSELQHHQY